MRLESTRLHGFPWNDDASGTTGLLSLTIPWSDLGPGLIAIEGANGCLDGDTLVDVPRDLAKHPGGIPIRDLVGTAPWLYAYDGKRIVLTRAARVWRTGTKPVLRVRFTRQHGQRGGTARYAPPGELVGTADHPVMLRDGTYRPLGALRPGDRLMPLYRRCRDGKYAWINRNDGTMILEHRLVAEARIGRPLRADEHAHHRDHETNPRATENNSMGNIEALAGVEHGAHHGRLHPPSYDVHPRGMAGKKHSETARAQIGAAVLRRNRARPELPKQAGQKAAATRRQRDPQPWHDAGTLRRLYLDEGLSTVQIAQRFGTNDVTIGYWLRKHEILARSPADGMRLRARQANHQVLSIEHAGERDVFDIEVAGLHNFVANGVVVHNSGKTTVLEGSGGVAWYRRWAYYGCGFGDHAGDDVRDAQLVNIYTYGDTRYRTLLQADPTRDKNEAYLAEDVGGEWRPIAAGAKAFDKAVAERFPPASIFYVSVCAVQPSKHAPPSLIGLDPRERKDVFMRLLDATTWQAWAKRAGELGDAATSVIADLRRELEQARVAAGRVQDLDRRLEIQAQVRTRCADEVARLTIAREDADAQVTTARRALDEALARDRQIREEYSALDADVAAARQERAALDKKAAQTQPLLEGEADIRAAVVELQAATTARDQALADFQAAEAALRPIAEELPVVKLRHESLSAEWRRLKDEWKRREAELSTRTGLLGKLEEPANPLCGRCPLTADARAASTTLAEERAAHDEKIAANVASGKEVGKRLSEFRDAHATHAAAVSTARGRYEDLAHQVEHLSRGAALLPQLEAAIAVRDALAPQREALDARIAKGAGDREAVDLNTPRRALAVADESLGRLVLELEQARRQETEAQAAEARLQGERETVAPLAATLPDLEQRAARAEVDVSDWRIAEQACGREGVQAIELDDAGPTVSAIANELLATWGRFSLELVTQAPRARGGVKEVFDVKIYDRGRARTLGSGGEQVIIDEALRLAIAIRNRERSGFPLETLWRDETGAPLDQLGAHRYLDMLRAAQQRGHFWQVPFISHNPAVSSRADVRVKLERGAIRIEAGGS